MVAEICFRLPRQCKRAVDKELVIILLICLSLFFTHLKLELLAQFPALNDEKIFLCIKNGRPPNWIIWLTEYLAETI